jgi:lipopolysaccharide biosynthesis regulator YciM
MSSKSVSKRATSYWQRKRACGQRMTDLMQEKAAQERNPPTRDEVVCQKCGFKARYKFLRCPECGEERK